MLGHFLKSQGFACDFTKVLGKADSAQRRVRRKIHKRLKPCEITTPVFVVGCQRSGTSMTMRVFDFSLDATIYQARDKRAFEHSLLKSDEVIRKLLERSRTAVTVFKPMNQIQHTRRFLEAFPGLKVVWLLRRYEDAVNSCVRKWNTMIDILKRIATDPSKAGWQGEGLSRRNIELVKTHFYADMSFESAYAMFWYLRNSFYFELALENEASVRIFRYEDLVLNPEQRFAEMFEFCGCPFHPNLTREIFSSSIGKHFSPKIDAPIEKLCQELSVRFNTILGG